MAPSILLSKPKRVWLSAIVDAALEPYSSITCAGLNMKLKTFQVLLQVQFARHRDLANIIENKIRAREWPKEYWKALLALLRGEALVELTDVEEEGLLDHSFRSS